MIGLLVAFIGLNILCRLLQQNLQTDELRPKQRPLSLWLLDNVIIATPFLITLLLTQRILLATLVSVHP